MRKAWTLHLLRRVGGKQSVSHGIVKRTSQGGVGAAAGACCPSPLLHGEHQSRHICGHKPIKAYVSNGGNDPHATQTGVHRLGEATIARLEEGFLPFGQPLFKRPLASRTGAPASRRLSAALALALASACVRPYRKCRCPSYRNVSVYRPSARLVRRAAICCISFDLYLRYGWRCQSVQLMGRRPGSQTVVGAVEAASASAKTASDLRFLGRADRI